MELTFRSAQSADAPHGAELLARSMARFGDCFFGLGNRALQLAVLQKLWQRDDNCFSHRLAQFALLDGRVAGLALTFGGEKTTALNLGILRSLHRLYSVGQALRFIRLGLHLVGTTEALRDEYLLSNLAVFPWAEGCGVGRALLCRSDNLARQQGFAKIALVVEMDNPRARGLYLSHGYRVAESRPTPHLSKPLGTVGTERWIKNL